MKVTLRASTGAKIHVWRQDEMFHSQLAGQAADPQICLGVDLFEVVAELAGLELDDGPHTAEAIRLADEARAALGDADPGSGGDDSGPDPPAIAR